MKLTKLISILTFISVIALTYCSCASRFTHQPQPTSLPSPSPSLSPSPTPSPSPTSTSYYQETYPTQPTTKGGLVLGETTTKPTPTPDTPTYQHLFYSSDCNLDTFIHFTPSSSTTAIRYTLKPNFSATLTIWTTAGETILPKTLLQHSGVLPIINTTEELQLQIVSHHCPTPTDHWLILETAKL